MILCLVPKNTFFGVQPKSSTIILRQSHTPHKSSLGRMEMAELDRKCTRPSSDVNDHQNNLWTPLEKSCRGSTQRKVICLSKPFRLVLLRNLNRFLLESEQSVSMFKPHYANYYTAPCWDVRDPRNNFKGCQVGRVLWRRAQQHSAKFHVLTFLPFKLWNISKNLPYYL